MTCGAVVCLSSRSTGLCRPRCQQPGGGGEPEWRGKIHPFPGQIASAAARPCPRLLAAAPARSSRGTQSRSRSRSRRPFPAAGGRAAADGGQRRGGHSPGRPERRGYGRGARGDGGGGGRAAAGGGGAGTRPGAPARRGARRLKAARGAEPAPARRGRRRRSRRDVGAAAQDRGCAQHHGHDHQLDVPDAALAGGPQHHQALGGQRRDARSQHRRKCARRPPCRASSQLPPAPEPRASGRRAGSRAQGQGHARGPRGSCAPRWRPCSPRPQPRPLRRSRALLVWRFPPRSGPLAGASREPAGDSKGWESTLN